MDQSYRIKYFTKYNSSRINDISALGWVIRDSNETIKMAKSSSSNGGYLEAFA